MELLELESAARRILEDHGLVPGGCVDLSGKLVRCGTTGKPHGKDGAYIGHADEPACIWWKDWRTGDDGTAFLGEQRMLTAQERADCDRIMRERKAARDQELAATRKKAARKAVDLAGRQAAPDNNPYLHRKGVHAVPGLVEIEKDGQRILVIPAALVGGEIRTVQFIQPDGEKRFLSGGEKRGTFFRIRRARDCDAKTLYLAEGIATALSIHEATGGAEVLSCFDASNLVDVATAVRQVEPGRQIVVCADDDHGTEAKTERNIGIEKATEAARAVGGLLAVPSFKEPAGRSDFNDLHQAEGLDVVLAQLERAAPPESTCDGLAGHIAPVSFDKLELSGIKKDMLPCVLGEFCEAVAEGLQVPFELVLINALACVAVAGQRKYKVQVRDGYSEPLNIYAIAALPPGERKSATAEVCKRPLIDWETEAQEEARESIRNTQSERKTLERAIEAKRARVGNAKTAAARREVIAEVKALEAELPEVPAAPRLLIDDVTPEALPAFMERQEERAGIIEAEGGLFENLGGRYSCGIPNLDAVLKCWSGEAVRVDRKSGPPIVLREPALTICLSPQPDIIRGLVDKPGFRGRGLIGRFLFLLPKSRVGNRAVEPSPIPRAVQKRYAAKIDSILNQQWATTHDGRKTAHILRLSGEAYSEWLDFHRDIETALRPGGELELISDWGGKLHGAAIRLAGLLHLVEHDGPHLVPVGAQTMRQALVLAKVLVEHAKAAFALMGADPDIDCAKRILAWIQEQRIQTFQAREAFEKVKGRYPKMEQVRQGLNILEERAYIFQAQAVREAGQKGRSPSPRYSVNPLAFKGER